MTLPWQVVNDRRVFCGRCKHDQNQRRMENERFDTEHISSFYCEDCQCVYAICNECAIYITDGINCPNITGDDHEYIRTNRLSAPQPDAILAPGYVQETDVEGREGDRVTDKSSKTRVRATKRSTL